MSRYWFPFMLRDELDMLEMQLYEHYDKIHRFILVESPITFQGRPKRLYYDENKERFAQYADKIIHVVCDWLPPVDQVPDPWVREKLQRDAAMAGFMHLTEPDDLIIVADVDEIAGRRVFEADPQPVYGVNLQLCYTAADRGGTPGVNLVIARAGWMKESGFTVDGLRANRASFPELPGNGGFHFSWLGGRNAVHYKYNSWSHTEALANCAMMNAEDDVYRYGVGSTEIVRDYNQCPKLSQELRDEWPKWIKERKCPDIWFAPTSDEDYINKIRGAGYDAADDLPSLTE